MTSLISVKSIDFAVVPVLYVVDALVANDLLINRTAVYALRRTKKQIYSLQSQHKLQKTRSKNDVNVMFSEKFNMVLPAIVHGFKSLGQTHKVLFQTRPVFQKQHMFLTLKKVRR